MNLHKKIIGSSGFSHILHTLEYGNELCKCLSAVVRNEEAACSLFAFVPEGSSIPEDGNFKKSIGGVVRYLPGYLQDYLQRNEGSNASVIFDDVMASKGDAYLADSKTAFFVGDETYHCLDANCSAQKIDELVWATAVSWHFLCVCVNASMDSIVADDQFDVDAIGKNWEEIIIGAFDGEGFIHCRRNTADQT